MEVLPSHLGDVQVALWESYLLGGEELFYGVLVTELVSGFGSKDCLGLMACPSLWVKPFLLRKAEGCVEVFDPVKLEVSGLWSVVWFR